MPNGSEHSHILGEMTRKQALIQYGTHLRVIAVNQAVRDNESSTQLFEDGVILRSDTIRGWFIQQDKLAH